MLFLISPAKSLDYDTPVADAITRSATLPKFRGRSAELIRLMRKKTAEEVSTLMNISTSLANLNVGRYRDWSPDFTPANSKPAALAFNGDVYEGLEAKTLSRADLAWAQEHLVILSGLYGALRPLDLLQPYRLEMGIALENPAGKDLYDFWGDAISEELNSRTAGDAVSEPVVNLASQEYFKAVNRRCLRSPVIDCVFEDFKGGQFKIISFYAKRARGLMARHAIKRRVRTPAGLKTFKSEGYAYAPAASSPERLVFRRKLTS